MGHTVSSLEQHWGVMLYDRCSDRSKMKNRVHHIIGTIFPNINGAPHGGSFHKLQLIAETARERHVPYVAVNSSSKGVGLCETRCKLLSQRTRSASASEIRCVVLTGLVQSVADAPALNLKGMSPLR